MNSTPLPLLIFSYAAEYNSEIILHTPLFFSVLTDLLETDAFLENKVYMLSRSLEADCLPF